MPRKRKMENQNSVMLPSCEDENDPILLNTVNEIVEKNVNDLEEEFFIVSNIPKKPGEMQILENEDEISKMSQMCRTCATINDHLIPIFKVDGLEHDLCGKILKHLQIKVYENDTLPLQLCYHCAATLLAFNELSEGVLTAQTRLLRLQEQSEQRTPPINENEEAEENISTDNELGKNQLSAEEEQNKAYLKNEALTNETERSSSHNLAFKRCKIDAEFCVEEDFEKNQSSSSKGISSDKEHENSVFKYSIVRKSKSSETLVSENGKDAESSLNRQIKLIKKKKVHLVDTTHCQECDKNFSTVSGLRRHMKIVHEGLKKHECDICGRFFASRICRNEHRLIHTGEKPHICEICGKTFTQKASLYVHKRFHSEKLTHWCKTCGRGFKRNQELEKHNLIHTGEKPFSCNVCGKYFRSKGCISRHKKTHSKDKTFFCEFCGASFVQERYLKTHKKIRHKFPLVENEN